MEVLRQIRNIGVEIAPARCAGATAMHQHQGLALTCFMVMQIPVGSLNAFAGILLGQLCHVMNAKKSVNHTMKNIYVETEIT